jgi:hypothetical protein
MNDKEKISSLTADISVVVILTLLGLALFGYYLDRLLSWYQAIVAWFYEKNWQEFKTIFLILDLILFFFILWTVWRASLVKDLPGGKVSRADTSPVSPKEEISASWERVRELMDSRNSSDWHIALLRADAILDDALRRLGYQGETMADRLKIVDPTVLTSLDSVWSAHRLRNTMAHDPLQTHGRETIVEAIRAYEDALTELEMMEKV